MKNKVTKMALENSAGTIDLNTADPVVPKVVNSLYVSIIAI